MKTKDSGLNQDSSHQKILHSQMQPETEKSSESKRVNAVPSHSGSKASKKYQSKCSAVVRSKRKPTANCSSTTSMKQVPGVFEGVGKNRRVYIEGLGIVNDFMASDDLNECVEALLLKRPKHNIPPTVQTSAPQQRDSKADNSGSLSRRKVEKD